MVRGEYEQLRDMQVDSFLEGLSVKGVITDVQRDILSTYKVYMTYPFDREAAESKIRENNQRYVEMYNKVWQKPGYTPMEFSEMKEDDFRLNLWFQIQVLCGERISVGVI